MVSSGPGAPASSCVWPPASAATVQIPDLQGDAAVGDGGGSGVGSGGLAGGNTVITIADLQEEDMESSLTSCNTGASAGSPAPCYGSGSGHAKGTAGSSYCQQPGPGSTYVDGNSEASDAPTAVSPDKVGGGGLGAGYHGYDSSQINGPQINGLAAPYGYGEYQPLSANELDMGLELDQMDLGLQVDRREHAVADAPQDEALRGAAQPQAEAAPVHRVSPAPAAAAVAADADAHGESREESAESTQRLAQPPEARLAQKQTPLAAPSETSAPSAAAISHADSLGALTGVAGETAQIPGALMEGGLARLNKKKKDWEERYCVLISGQQDVSFAYLLELFESAEAARAGAEPLDRIHVTNAEAAFVQGTVFTVKTSGELNKKVWASWRRRVCLCVCVCQPMHSCIMHINTRPRRA